MGKNIEFLAKIVRVFKKTQDIGKSKRNLFYYEVSRGMFNRKVINYSTIETIKKPDVKKS